MREIGKEQARIKDIKVKMNDKCKGSEASWKIKRNGKKWGLVKKRKKRGLTEEDMEKTKWGGLDKKKEDLGEGKQVGKRKEGMRRRKKYKWREKKKTETYRREEE